MSLPTPAAFAGVEIPQGEDTFIATGDISNAFYRLAVPEHLLEHFSLHCLDASHLAEFGIDLNFSGGDNMVLPLVTVLPMGWSWSVFFCQSVLEQSIMNSVDNFRFIQDTHMPVMLNSKKELATGHSGDTPQLISGAVVHRQSCSSLFDDSSACDSLVKSNLAVGAYLDNFLVQGSCPHAVNKANRDIAQHLDSLGLLTHELTDADVLAEFVGLKFVNGDISVKESKFWKVKLGLDSVLSRNCASGIMLEVLVGHLVWVMLNMRASLACLEFAKTTMNLWAYGRLCRRSSL